MEERGIRALMTHIAVIASITVPMLTTQPRSAVNTFLMCDPLPGLHVYRPNYKMHKRS
jgi:hypothetical protein